MSLAVCSDDHMKLDRKTCDVKKEKEINLNNSKTFCKSFNLQYEEHSKV